MNTFLNKTFFFVATVLFSQIVMQPALAHSIEETTAKVILRDGQVEVRIHADLVKWANQLQNTQAWLMGETNDILPPNYTDAQKIKFLKDQISKHTHVDLMGKTLSLKITAFPKSLVTSHDLNSIIVLSGQHTFSSVEQVAVQLPKLLGPVYTTFVKPQYRMIAAGEKTQVSFIAQKSLIPNIEKTHQH